MSRHGRQTHAKDRARARLKKAFTRLYGRRHGGRRTMTPASSIRLKQRQNYERYANAGRKGRTSSGTPPLRHP